MKLLRRAVLLAILIFAFAEVGLAMPFAEYRQRVKTAITTLKTLRESEAAIIFQGDSVKQTSLQKVREGLPARAIVEWNETKYFINNSWLENQLKEFERAGTSKASGILALVNAQERLEALDEHLTNIEVNKLNSSKAEMRDQLASILMRPEYQRTVQGESALERLWKRIERLLNRLLPRRRQVNPDSATVISRISQILVIALALAVIGYAAWKLAPRFLKGRQSKKSVKEKARVVLGERLEPDRSAADLLAEAEALARSGDLRGAIRRGYIALLVELADRKIISLEQHKTNRDYLRSVRGIGKLHRNLESLTNNFEVHWYGLVPAEETDWIAFRAGYKEALTSS
jgi:hypothetical protein